RCRCRRVGRHGHIDGTQPVTPGGRCGHHASEEQKNNDHADFQPPIATHLTLRQLRSSKCPAPYTPRAHSEPAARPMQGTVAALTTMSHSTVTAALPDATNGHDDDG